MAEVNTDAIKKKILEISPLFHKAISEIGKVIVGQSHLIHSLFLGLLSDGHIILEGVPGLAKTLAVKTLSSIIQCDFKRIQFTPDLLPADLIGTTIFNPKEGTFSTKKGPIFTNLLLADEINRAPPKVQSALLEVMQERQVTIEGTTYKTGHPFLVLATQNPIELEGTYPLPEAQTDRFMMKVKINYPTKEDEKEILNRMATLGILPEAKPVLSSDEILNARKIVDEVYIDEKVINYILDIVFATRYPNDYDIDIAHLLQFGASPRATMALKICAKAHAFLSEKPYVSPHDIKEIAHDILRHRIRRSYEAEAENISSDQIIDMILETIPVP